MLDKTLSKLYKKFLNVQYGKVFRKTPSDVTKWARANNRLKTIVRTKSTGKILKPTQKMLAVVDDYYESVFTEAIKYPNTITVKYFGAFFVQDISGITGKPRYMPKEDGDGYEEVVDDYFTSHPRYYGVFSLNKNKVKSKLRVFFSSGMHRRLGNKIIKQAYKLYPNGKFYRHK